MFMSKKIILNILGVICLSAIAIPSVFGFNLIEKLTQAQLVYACTASETLSGANCVFERTPIVAYTLGCANGFTQMDAICTKSTQQTCADYNNAEAISGNLCKLTNPASTLISEVLDYDGRQCNGEGFNLKKYNSGLPNGSTAGPIICANILSVISGKENFRFIPKTVTETDIIRSITTNTELPPCPSNFIVVGTQCSRAATPKTCDQNGEFFDGTTCQPCPIGKICIATAPITRTNALCPNGGNLVAGECVISDKATIISYTDGCGTGYIKLDKTCAIEEIRTHDLGCTYFYASEFVNIKAVEAGNGLCSTGGRTDFDSTSITKVSDLECNGPGSGWYNYNVAYDPLVCGNNLALVGKSGFRWSAKTYIKITTLQKLPSALLICPLGWVEIFNNRCKQPAIIQEFRDPTSSLTSSSSSLSNSSANISSLRSVTPFPEPPSSSAISSSSFSSSITSTISSSPTSLSSQNSSSVASSVSSQVSTSSSTRINSSSSSQISSNMSSSILSSSSINSSNISSSINSQTSSSFSVSTSTSSQVSSLSNNSQSSNSSSLASSISSAL